jgi:hypothetical protein
MQFKFAPHATRHTPRTPREMTRLSNLLRAGPQPGLHAAPINPNNNRMIFRGTGSASASPCARVRNKAEKFEFVQARMISITGNSPLWTSPCHLGKHTMSITRLNKMIVNFHPKYPVGLHNMPLACQNNPSTPGSCAVKKVRNTLSDNWHVFLCFSTTGQPKYPVTLPC